MESLNEKVKEKWKKNIILFLGSQTISLFGSSLVQYAIMWYITLNTQSGVMMTISTVCGFVPTFILSPIAGVWADRYNRKMLIILSDSLIAFSTLILAILFLIGYDELWLLFVMSAVRAIGTGIQTPAVGAILPQLVPEDKLTKVNGTNGSIQALVMLVSPMVSGALLTMASIETLFLLRCDHCCNCHLHITGIFENSSPCEGITKANNQLFHRFERRIQLYQKSRLS